MFWDLGNEYFMYKYYENITEKHQTDFSFFRKSRSGSSHQCEHKLTFLKTIEYGGPEDSQFDLTFNGKPFYDFRKGLSNSELREFDKLFQSSGHKNGGYAYFTQYDPRKSDPERKNDVLLLQIDTDKEIMWGDAGISNIFINPDDLKKKKIDMAYFYWDCA